jgi:O-antigen ligase
MIGDFPLGGTGAGSFSSSFPRYRGAGIDFFYDHAHNDYLQFAAELGIPAALVLLAFCGLSLVTAIRAQFRRRDPWMQGMAFSATMAIVAMAIHGTVEFNLQIPANTATFMVLLALAWLSAYMPGETRREKT